MCKVNKAKALSSEQDNLVQDNCDSPFLRVLHALEPVEAVPY